MRKAMSCVALFAIISIIIISSSDARSSIIQKPKPNPNFKINVTRCSSVTYTRDEISISFGDAYGNQVYAPRLDDPARGTFEQSCNSWPPVGRWVSPVDYCS